ncbi:MAG: FAD-dependent oxidoreductase, partial [Alphaproteobacteria bacterium]|nr:FAD-dependent oxidoreductase [Alphaproteobacteria bacterium]
MPQDLPRDARVVIIGGGIVGCSVAYHLTKLGWQDVVLLEQGQLSGGTTWHAAGLVGQLRANEDLTRLIQYSTELYAGLETETGLGTGWRQCGSVAVARTADRMIALRRIAAKAHAYGVEAEVIGPEQAGKLWPVMRTDDLQGAVWIPRDGKANPSDLTQALAKGARNGGARIFEKTRVTGITVESERVTAVETAEGSIRCEVAVNCAGQWARQVGAMVGVPVPLYSCEHMYIVTRPMDGVSRDLPVMRDYDGYIYFKEEVGGLVMGGFEPVAKPISLDRIPDEFEFALLPDDWDQFEILMQNALHRVPALETTEVRQFVNGPESFTPDANYILGAAPGLENFFVGAGFNSMGIASAGGAGKALAEWIVEGAPTMDLWPVDIRRFAPFHNSEPWLRARVSEVLGTHYAMPWPNRELVSGRPLRQSPFYRRHEAKKACFGSKMGWERPLWFAPDGVAPEIEYSYGKQNWFPYVAEECRAVRDAVGLFDQTSFSKFLLTGRHSERALQGICANDVAVPPGRVIYTGMLNDKGGYESDLTVTRLAPDAYFIVTGSAQAVRDYDWIARHIPPDADAALTDVTSGYAVLGLMGPRSRELLASVTDADVSDEAFPFATMRQIEIAFAPVRALRITYVGELGWELYVPTEFATVVYDALQAAGEDVGLRDAGYYAMESLRLEKGYRAWGHDLAPDVTPMEAGLSFAVAFDKETPFSGQAVLLRKRAETVARRLVSFTLDDPDAVLYGGELLLRDGEAVGDVRSGGYGFSLGRSVALGLVHNEGG